MVTTTIMIDYDFMKKNIKILDNFFNITQTMYNIGLIISISEIELNKLEKLSYGKARIDYFNSKIFVDSIKGYSFILYNKQKRICEIYSYHQISLEDVLDSILKNLPNNILIFIGINPDNKIALKDVAKLGFQNPYMSEKSPVDLTYQNNKIILSKKNDIDTVTSDKEIGYILKQIDNKQCEITIKLSPYTIKYFKKLSEIALTLNNNGTISQKEVAGLLDVKSIDINFIHTLNVNKKSLIYGDEEGVQIVGGLYNFHSHPISAYKNHKTNYGWPSSQDYVGFLKSYEKEKTILHLVITVEGIYIISLAKEWINNNKKILKDISKFILKNFDIDRNKYNNKSFVEKVNTISFDNVKIFLTQFLDWSHINNTFSVYYPKNGINCFNKNNII